MDTEKITPPSPEGQAEPQKPVTLDFGKFAPLPWRARDTQDSRGWTVVDARGETVAIFPRLSIPTREAAETIAFAINAWTKAEIQRLEAALAKAEGRA